MKQTTLPGIELPKTRPSAPSPAPSPGPSPVPPPVPEDAQWPSTGELLAALAECELPSPSVPPEPGAARLLPLTILGMGLAPVLPSAHQDAINACTVLAAGRTLAARFTHLDAERIVLRAPLHDAIETLLERRRAGARVVVLADGDPLFFGIGATLARLLPPEDLRILPGVSALQEACARACLPWHDVRCVSLHGRGDTAELAAAAMAGGPICLLTDARSGPDAIARFLLDRGVDWHRMHVFENMGREGESVQVCELPEAARRAFGSACTVLLVPCALPRGPCLGIADAQLASEGGLFTKVPARAAALAALRIRPGDLVWDLGAGSGAVALEACALAHRNRVFAVERKSARVLCMEENRRRFGAANLEIVAGSAPDCLDELPDPDAVFIGGGLGDAQNAHALLSAVSARLKAGGRLAINCVLMDSLEICRAFFRTAGWTTRIHCLQAAETRPLNEDMRLAALNPVFVFSAAKDGKS